LLLLGVVKVVFERKNQRRRREQAHFSTTRGFPPSEA
jgi:hypothetical protein